MVEYAPKVTKLRHVPYASSERLFGSFTGIPARRDQVGARVLEHTSGKTRIRSIFLYVDEAVRPPFSYIFPTTQTHTTPSGKEVIEHASIKFMPADQIATHTERFDSWYTRYRRQPALQTAGVQKA